MTDPEIDEEKRKKKFSPLTGTTDKIKGSGKGLIDKGIQKGKAVTDRVTEVAIDAADKIDKTVKKVGQEISDEIVKQTVTTGVKTSKGSSQGIGGAFENQLFSWYGWFTSTIGYIILILLAFMISTSNPSFGLLPIILLIGFPLYILWMLYNIIPEVSIGGRTIISRKQVSLRRQLTFGKAIARTFSREMWKNSPEMAILILVFILVLLYSIFNPIIN